MKIIFLFIDGLGLRSPASDNPVNPEVCPTLCRLIAHHSVPIDACLSVAGLPQSATGQTTMFTGVNASILMGRHCTGYASPTLQKKIQENNLFLQLKALGKRVKFANSFSENSAAEIALRPHKSVTVCMALTLPEVLSYNTELLDGQALSQDLTRETLQDRYVDMPLITPEEAAENLISIARGYDFTLFEFFQSDLSGHSMDYARACTVLRTYDHFLSELVRFTQSAQITLLMTSDHGNVEAINERGHTRNPVPFVARGPHEELFRAHIHSLIDVTPTIVRLMQEDSQGFRASHR